MASLYFTTLVAALLLISSTQAKPKLEENAIVEEIQQWAKEKLLGAIDEIKKAEQDLKDTVTAALESSRQDLQEAYASSLVEYHLHKEELHDKCFQQGLTHLTSYEPIDLPTATELFAVALKDDPAPKANCVTAAIMDVGKILYSVARYIATILETLDDILNGYTLCSQGAWWRKFTCLFTYVGTAISDIYHTLADVGEMVRNIQSNATDLSNQIHNCTSPKKVQIRQQLLYALDNANECNKMHA